MEKTLVKIAGIVAIVLGVIMCITIVGAIVGVPLIIGGCKFNDYSKMDDSEFASNKDSILIWSIVFLFLSIPSGVLGLIAYFLFEAKKSDYFGNYKSNKKYDELERIKKLYDDKVLTKEEYESEKSRILNSNR